MRSERDRIHDQFPGWGNAEICFILMSALGQERTLAERLRWGEFETLVICRHSNSKETIAISARLSI